MESALMSPGHLLIVGDKNLHVDDPGCSEANQFIDLYTSLGLVRHVVGPTHDKGHTLDLVLSRTTDPWLANFVIDRSLPSDHAAVHFTSVIHRPPPSKITKSHRVLTNLDISVSKNSIVISLQDSSTSHDVNDLTRSYSALSSAIDEHAPGRTKTITGKPHGEWFTPAHIEERRLLRSFERLWLNSRLEVDKQIFLALRTDAVEMYVGAVEMLLDIAVFCVIELAASERRLFVVYNDRG